MHVLHCSFVHTLVHALFPHRIGPLYMYCVSIGLILSTYIITHRISPVYLPSCPHRIGKFGTLEIHIHCALAQCTHHCILVAKIFTATCVRLQYPNLQKSLDKTCQEIETYVFQSFFFDFLILICIVFYKAILTQLQLRILL